jgi:two-component system sensor histidine kinase DesK
MTSGTRSAGPGAANPGSWRRRLASRVAAASGPTSFSGPVRLSAIWLLYLGQPIGSLFGHHYGALYIAGAAAITIVFCAAYLWVIEAWGGQRERRGRTTAGILALMFTLAALACVVYDGAKWNVLWIYVSVACGLVIAERRIAIRAVLATGGCCLLFSWLGHDRLSDFLVTLIPVLLLGFVMIGFRMRIGLSRELAAARETVARMAANEERLRMARDMHDLTGQSLSMITLKSELAARLLGRLPASPERDRARQEVEQVAAVSRQTLHDIREAVSGYRRPTLDIEVITARTAFEAAGITPHEDGALTLLSGTFDPDAESALAWCLREAATNVIRHSGAKNCHISLTRRADTLSLTVRDDGLGPSARLIQDECDIQLAIGSSMSHSSGADCGGTGLHGMSERLTAVGGHLELRPGKPAGFCLIATVPATVPAAENTTENTPGTTPEKAAPAARTVPARTAVTVTS